MIKLQDLTPDVYYNESRDFQFIGRLYDLVLNSVKTEADSIYALPLTANSDDQFLTLMAMTLGFKLSHHYTAKQLRAICQVFPQILKNKGSIKAILIACSALFNAEGIDQEVDYDFTKGSNNTELNIYIPDTFGDVVILNDLLAYTLPAGMSCNIIKELAVKEASQTNIGITDEAKLYKNSTVLARPYKYNNNDYAVIPIIPTTASVANEANIIRGITVANSDDWPADFKGFRANGSIYKVAIAAQVEEEQENNN